MFSVVVRLLTSCLIHYRNRKKCYLCDTVQSAQPLQRLKKISNKQTWGTKNIHLQKKKKLGVLGVSRGTEGSLQPLLFSYTLILNPPLSYLAAFSALQ